MERRAAIELLPLEIKGHLLVECLKNSVNDVVSLLRVDKSFHKAASTVAWREIYYKLYQGHDELNVDKPSHAIKIFLRYFLPSKPQANKDWLKALILRQTYDDHLLAANVDKTEQNRSGWRTVPHEKAHPNLFHYHESLPEDFTYRYGFTYNFGPVMNIIESIENKFHLCFLELTIGRFFADPTDYPISAIDYYHFTKVVNVHVMYSKHLCSKPIPDPLPEVASSIPGGYNNFNESECLFLNGDNLEYTIQPGREWGIYTNYACQGILWGHKLDELLKWKYQVDVSLYDTNLFVHKPQFVNFKNLTQ